MRAIKEKGDQIWVIKIK